MTETLASGATELSEGLETFGRYTILRALGQGGVGAVFLARKTGAREICVLKKLLAEHQENSNLIRRFRREANLCSHLDHPNIARILDAGTEDGTFFIAFEYVAGQPLSSLCAKLYTNRVWLAWEHAVAIALDVLDGLTHAHERTDPENKPLHLIHRDLSPNNILVGYDGRTKIIDFGLASGRVDDLKTQPGELLGTYRYMSPEQALLKPLDQRSDLYTVAVVLHELLAKERMVPRGNVREILGHIAVSPAPLLSAIVPSLPEGLTPVLKRALEKDPTKRFQTARALRDALIGVPGVSRAEPSAISGLILAHFAADKVETDRILSLGGALARNDTINPRQIEATAMGAPSTFKPAPTRERRIAHDWPPEKAPEPTEEPTTLAASGPSPPAVEISTYFPRSKKKSTSSRAERIFFVGVIVLLNLIAIGVILALSFPRRSPLVPDESVAPTVVPRPEQPHAVVVAEAEPPPSAPLESEAVEPEPPSEPASVRRIEGTKAPRPRAPERAAKRASEAPETPAPASVPAFPHCRELLQKLQAQPSDSALLVKLYRELKKEADRLPPEKRKPIYVEIDAGLRGGDVESMERGLGRLVEASR